MFDDTTVEKPVQSETVDIDKSSRSLQILEWTGVNGGPMHPRHDHISFSYDIHNNNAILTKRRCKKPITPNKLIAINFS
jgi:hypothetical protein